jgi:hypothetical protein
MKERLEMLAREGEEERKRREDLGILDAGKLQYFTMAAWMRGYVAGLKEYEDKKLIHQLNKAADMLDAVWGKYSEEMSDD